MSQYLKAITIIWQRLVDTKITIRSEQSAAEMGSTPGTRPENSPEIILQSDTTYDGRDVDHDTQPDADTSVEQLDLRLPTPAAQNTIYAMTQNQIVMMTTDIDSVK